MRKKGTQEILTNEKEDPLTPMEAMVMAVVNNAMRGDIPAIQFVRKLTARQGVSDDDNSKRRENMTVAVNDIRQLLLSDHVNDGDIPLLEVERLAHDLLTLRRLERVMEGADHRDFDTDYRRDGSEQLTLSPVNRIHGDLQKRFAQDLRDLRTDIQRRILSRKALRR